MSLATDWPEIVSVVKKIYFNQNIQAKLKRKY